uniref:Uncharacterized protein n=1 Tax=Anguilla anguilla TaxID=7936 RepID=A0A0E9Q0C0_ANGAN
MGKPVLCDHINTVFSLSTKKILRAITIHIMVLIYTNLVFSFS